MFTKDMFRGRCKVVFWHSESGGAFWSVLSKEKSDQRSGVEDGRRRLIELIAQLLVRYASFAGNL